MSDQVTKVRCKACRCDKIKVLTFCYKFLVSGWCDDCEKEQPIGYLPALPTACDPIDIRAAGNPPPDGLDADYRETDDYLG